MGSVFLEIEDDQWVASNDLAFAIFDRFPVSEGHVLVITKRETPDWWSCTHDERAALMDLVERVRELLDERFQPDGYNVGFNAGEAAGQTVLHVHVHVIPRYGGDTDDPRGGVRHVIPERGNYKVPWNPAPLITPAEGRMRRALTRALLTTEFDRIDLLVSFVQRSGLTLIEKHLDAALERGAQVRVLTTDYLGITDPAALGYFLDRLGETALEARVFSDPTTSFHPKAYLFTRSSSGRGLAIVGSSNLSRSALEHGIEWNLQTKHLTELHDAFEQLWNDPRALPLQRDWLVQYTERRPTQIAATSTVEERDVVDGIATESGPEPTTVQREALDALERTRSLGFEAGLVVMATGLGKTWLAAFDSTRPSFRRVLFVAHREEILKQSRDVFRRVRPDGDFTMFMGDERDTSGDVVFAGVQSLVRHLDRVEPDAFDYVVVDEFHHADAPTYRRVLSHLRPTFLLGLTATPERSDRADLLALCADNLVYECDLVAGIQQNLLSPFAYRAIRDVADYAEIPWRAGRFDIVALAERLETQERAGQVLREWRQLGDGPRRALGFCCSITHANFMAQYFSEAGVTALAVHSGQGSAPRDVALEQLHEGTVEVLFTVDLFNEGVDVPVVDTVLMLRPTESLIVFMQQLGRGLRKHPGKERLDVVDLVGNHHGFLLKARLLVELGGVVAPSSRQAVERLSNDDLELPPGCSIVVDTEVVDLFREMLGRRGRGQHRDELLAWVEAHGGRRPTALEYALHLNGPLPSVTSGWFGLLRDTGLLSGDEAVVTTSQVGDFLREIEKGAYTKSFKLVTLQAMLNARQLNDGMPLRELALGARWLVLRDRRLRNDLANAARSFTDPSRPSDGEWLAYWRRNPIDAWTAAGRADAVPWFRLEGERFMPAFSAPDGLEHVVDDLVGEIVEYRLHRYLATKQRLDFGERRLVRTADGVLDAEFVVETTERGMTVVIESAGGTRGSDNARNLDYADGFRVIVFRLAHLDAVLDDIFVDSASVRELSIADRRLDVGAPLPLRLLGHDLQELQRRALRSMARVGRDDTSQGGGNQRKRVRFVVGGVDLNDVDLADCLAAGVETEGDVTRSQPVT
jgi:superfamily II DNA or RNA helicase/diadenosine tetraphosphate (Ap4A) HIT family hydrolase/HKD family nuclease